MPPTQAVLRSGSTRSTWPNADTSRPAPADPAALALRSLWPAEVAGPSSRNLNRLEVRLASRTGVPGGQAAYDSRNPATATSCVSAVMRTSFRLRAVTRHLNDHGRAKGKIHAELDEHLRQCIPERQALLLGRRS